MSVRTETHVPTEEGGVTVDSEVPPPLIVDGVIETTPSTVVGGDEDSSESLISSTAPESGKLVHNGI